MKKSTCKKSYLISSPFPVCQYIYIYVCVYIIHGNKLKILIHQHLVSWSIAIWWKSKLGLSSLKPAAVPLTD